MKKILSLVTIFSTITAVTFIAWCSKQNTAQIGDTVEINYTATLPDGSTFKTTEGQDTLRFVVGSGEVIPGLDEGVINMKLNKTKTLKIAADKAYGTEYEKTKIQKIWKDIFTMSKLTPIQGEKLKLGETEGLVRGFETNEKGFEYVLFDINPPYTYETLTYKVTIISLEKKLP